MQWMNTGSRTKSEPEVTRLVKEVLTAPDFNPDDLKSHFNAHTENRRADEAEPPQGSASFFAKFREVSIKIDVPSGEKGVPPKPFDIPGLLYRPLLSVIQTAFTEPLAEKFHLSPFRLFRQLPDSKDVERVFSELYNSDAFINEHPTHLMTQIVNERRWLQH
jgi:hypothetical protein